MSWLLQELLYNQNICSADIYYWVSFAILPRVTVCLFTILTTLISQLVHVISRQDFNKGHDTCDRNKANDSTPTLLLNENISNLQRICRFESQYCAYSEPCRHPLGNLFDVSEGQIWKEWQRLSTNRTEHKLKPSLLEIEIFFRMPTNAGIFNSAHFLATLQISPAFQGLTSLA